MSAVMERSPALKDVVAAIQEETFRSYYFGVPIVKNPIDLWTYREIITETRPDAVVEIGTHRGGTLLAIAHILDVLGHGIAVGVDVDTALVHSSVRSHPRVRLVGGDAVASVGRVRESVGKRCMVIEDSSHTMTNTLAVMEAYAQMVGDGCYLVVEDSICHHGLDHGPAPGPFEAIEAFLRKHPEWESDRSRERFVLTWNPRGYLRRRAA